MSQDAILRASISSRDPDEIGAFLRRRAIPAAVSGQAGTIAFDMAWARLTDDFAVWRAGSSTGLDMDLGEEGAESVAIWIGLAGDLHIEHASGRAVGTSARPVVGSLRDVKSLGIGPGRDGIVVSASGRYLSGFAGSGLGDLDAEVGVGSVSFLATFEDRSPLAAAIEGYGGLLFEALGAEAALVRSELAIQRYLDAFCGLVLCALPRDRLPAARRPPTSSSLGEVRRAEEYMRANAKRPIGMKQVAEAAGVSVRTLQYGFKRHRDVSPHAALHRFRLEGARGDILAKPAGRIADIALAWGFTHLGRFASQYKAAFGELPSHTLGRSRR